MERESPQCDIGQMANGDELREAVLHVGARLGWPPAEVADFAEALTGCPWPRADRAELLLVLGEFLGLIGVIQAKEARRRAWRATSDVAPA
jgi:hypothetical protein